MEVRHLPRPDDRPLEVQVAEAVDGLYRDGLQGHTLVFLPGAAEIRQGLAGPAPPAAARHGLKLLPLHGSLGFDAQQEAVAPCPDAQGHPQHQRGGEFRDPGRGRGGGGFGPGAGGPRIPPGRACPGLRTARISQARCVQRAGRAGRTGPGLCLRLFTQADFNARPAFDSPEILRADLAETLLALADLG